MSSEAMTFREINEDLVAYLNGEIVDPIGYLETLQLRLQVALDCEEVKQDE